MLILVKRKITKNVSRLSWMAAEKFAGTNIDILKYRIASLKKIILTALQFYFVSVAGVFWNLTLCLLELLLHTTQLIPQPFYPPPSLTLFF